VKAGLHLVLSQPKVKQMFCQAANGRHLALNKKKPAPPVGGSRFILRMVPDRQSDF
jgi:hypothetical protein